MSEFDLFEKALNIYETNENFNKIEKDVDPDEPEKCIHTNTTYEKDILHCDDCGEQMLIENTFDKEWRYYGAKDTKNSNDPTRVQMRKNEDKNIYKDVENMGFNHYVVEKANEIYHEVTKDNIKRGNSRKGIVFACIFQAYKLNGNPQTYESLIKHFTLSKKAGLAGIKHVSLNIPKDSDIHTTYITPEHLIKDIIFKFKGATIDQYDEILKIYYSIKNKNTKLNRARPQSVAAGLVFFWIQNNHKNISIKDFTSMVNLSELTVCKMVKLIKSVYIT